MILGTIFEMLGAITVGARTADTIKNGIIPNDAFQGNAGVQMLAFTCALAAASTWVMWCTRHSAHVSSTYSLISAVAGVGVATVGASKVQWGWNKGKGLGAIFAGLGMAPCIAGGFGASIFLLIKFVVHVRKNPAKWAVYTAPIWFLIAGTVCTLSIVYKGSPNLGLGKKPGWYIAAVTMGTGGGICLLSALFFVPFVYAKIINKDHTIKWYNFIQGPLLLKRAPPADANLDHIPNYAVVQHDEPIASPQSQLTACETDLDRIDGIGSPAMTSVEAEKNMVISETRHTTYKDLIAESEKKFNDRLLNKRGPLGWAMRTLRDNPIGAGEVYEFHNMKVIVKRIPALIVCGALYGLNYDIHAAQTGVEGTPEGDRMKRVYDNAEKYANEVEHTYSFVQVLTACTASFAHGANDIGNSVGPWAVIYSAWSTGNAAAAKQPVPVWQLAVLAATISLGLITYGYNIMKGTLLTIPNQLPEVNANQVNSHGQQDYLSLPQPRLLHGDGCRHHRPRLLPILSPRLHLNVHYWCHCRCRTLQRNHQGRQLPASWASGYLLDCHHPHRRHSWWCDYGSFLELAPFLSLSELCIS